MEADNELVGARNVDLALDGDELRLVMLFRGLHAEHKAMILKLVSSCAEFHVVVS